MEQKDYREAPLQKIKELTKAVPAAVSSATSSLSTFTSEHKFKDVIKIARSKLWRDSSDDDNKHKAEVDDLIVLNDSKKSSEPLERASAIRASALFKRTQPSDKLKPNSRWHVPPPLPLILDEPIKPDSSANSVHSAIHDKTTTPAHRQPLLIGFEPLTVQPIPLPRTLFPPPTINIEDADSPSRPQSLKTPVPLPRTKFPSQQSEENAPSYNKLLEAALAVENSPTGVFRGPERPESLSKIENDECPICFTNNSRDSAIIPCGHVYCEKCAQQQFKEEGTCYICKRDIIMVNKVYFN